jgi:hypothetical protein
MIYMTGVYSNTSCVSHSKSNMIRSVLTKSKRAKHVGYFQRSHPILFKGISSLSINNSRSRTILVTDSGVDLSGTSGVQFPVPFPPSPSPFLSHTFVPLSLTLLSITPFALPVFSFPSLNRVPYPTLAFPTIPSPF